MAMAEHLFFLFAIFAAVVVAQPGFISIDCGIPGGSDYTDSETGIFYTSDAGFVRSGENREFPSSNLVASSLKRLYRSMRSFPDGERNCYTVRPVQKGSKYFVRASFMYVDYDTQNTQNAPEFDLYVGINLWTRISIADALRPYRKEIVLVATMDFIPVCLVNTGSGEPFISAVEARLLKDTMYAAVSNNQSLLAEFIYDVGSTSEQIIRYPDDDYDRFWLPYTDPSWASISTSLTVENLHTDYDKPLAVMRTAATPMNSNGSLYFNWKANDNNTEFHMFIHFADFQKSNGSTTLREFSYCINGDSCLAYKLEYLDAFTVYTASPWTGFRDYSISFSKTEKSVLPPILNAFEIYAVLTLNETATDEKDVDAIMNIKGIYGLEKNWVGDPCLYFWDGLTCSYDNDNPPRIISLNLSSSGLSGKIHASIGNLKLIRSLDLSKNNIEGPIPPFLATLTSLAHLDLSQNNLTGTVPQFLAELKNLLYLNLSLSGLSGKIDASIGNLKLIQSLDLSKNNIEGPIPSFLATLTSLAHLDLSQNNLTGTVPQFLAELKNLSYLNLSHNQLSGSVPISLVDKSRTGSLTLSVDPNLCNSPSCNATDPYALKPCKKSPSVVVPVVVVVAIVTVAIGIAVLIWFKCRRPRAARPNPQNIKREGSFNLETRRFSYEEIVTVTNNFQRVIGKGAFATVYHGQMKDGTEVAVKMLSLHAHASIEFQTEAQLLMTLHHRHLVRFIGYCADGDKKALIFEYMSKGNLGMHLAAQDEMKTLSWDQRLRIGLAVSQGLEYLHVGCKPPIIHRDVKAANILLNENFEAKLADFGICKVFTDEYYTHISTQVKGTRGYLDPEYLSSCNLNEKSDVYSFGVVLLELITGRPAIIQTRDSQKIGLVEWVSSLISGGDVRNIMDPKLQTDYDITSAWKALDISISCTQPKCIQRPSISSVVAELKDCLKVEQCTDRSSGMVTAEFVARCSSNSIYCPLPR